MALDRQTEKRILLAVLLRRQLWGDHVDVETGRTPPD